MTLSNPNRIKEAYLAGWKAAINSLQNQSFVLPTEFNDTERDIAEQCYHEDYADSVGDKQTQNDQ